MKRLNKILIAFFIVFIVITSCYCYLYYPQQTMPVGVPILVETPEYDKYRNDCLHPCIRYDEKLDIYHMAQSPYYGWNNKVENPIYYTSTSYMQWSNGTLLAETPATGYNSDPCIFLHKDTIVYLWRECGTPRCDSLGVTSATVGGILSNGKIDDIKVYATNMSSDFDVQQCPIIMTNNAHDSLVYTLYAAWYQYHPERISKGLAIWEGSSITQPDFHLIDTIPLPSVYTVDRCAQLRLFDHIWYMPISKKHDIWHFDLFEYDDKLYMVSVAEKGDNIMLSVSEDYRHFKTYRKPLVNNHYSENFTGYRQYFYKPTAFVKNDSLFVFYTANAKDDPNRNQLFLTSDKIDKIIR